MTDYLFKVELGIYGCTFTVHADHEQDAFDEVMDHCKEHAKGFVMSRDEADALEFPDEYMRGVGNCGDTFSCPAHEMRVTIISDRR